MCICVVIFLFGIPAVGGNVLLHFQTSNIGNIDPTNEVNILDYSLHLAHYGIHPFKETLTFEVQACTDVNVYLSASPIMNSLKPFYNVVIGGNYGNRVYLRRIMNGVFNQSRYFGIDSQGVINCTYYKQFWLTWRKGYLRIGKGFVVNQTEIDNYDYQDMFPVKAIGIQTAWGSDGQWLITKKVPRPGKYCGLPDIYANAKVLIVQSFTRVFCSSICEILKDCFGFNNEIPTKTCEMISTETGINANTRTNWTLYVKC